MRINRNPYCSLMIKRTHWLDDIISVPILMGHYKMFVASVVCNPYEIVHTEGEHVYRKCEGCQRNRRL